MKSGPDFLGVGMQKAATRTLHSFLSLDERFWMPLIKEFHHFDDPSRPLEERHRRVMRHLPVMERGRVARAALNLARRATGRRRVTDSDLQFLRKYQAYLASGRTDAAYMDLFSVCPQGRVTGDITPAYSTLDEEAIARIRELLPDARILLVIRDPVARAWSHANMNLRKKHRREDGEEGRADRTAMQEAVKADDYLDNALTRSVLAKGSPTKIYRTWAAAYGDAVEILSFEEVCSQQRAVADRIAALFGLPARPAGAEGGALVRNRKSSLAKVPMGEREREFLVDVFRDELVESRKLFGEEKTRGWLENYGLA